MQKKLSPCEKQGSLGTAYQLADDILDASGNEAVSGKTLGRDAQRGKTTAMTSKKVLPMIRSLSKRSPATSRRSGKTMADYTSSLATIYRRTNYARDQKFIQA